MAFRSGSSCRQGNCVTTATVVLASRVTGARKQVCAGCAEALLSAGEFYYVGPTDWADSFLEDQKLKGRTRVITPLSEQPHLTDFSQAEPEWVRRLFQ